ncbi:glucose 1-dehydrogenase [Streptomyces sp. NPDC048281]|uniref:SDR family NAD(P)-dependent oxidoreductase n=1 Tax=Streptomyces sp. NPDC048281 TaxID=3154715 RepID=UPI00343C16B2
MALVTGAASGIGRATVEAFVEEGARVTVVDIAVEEGEATVDRVGSDHAIFVRADVSDLVAMENAVRRTVQTWGRLDVAHNNAGIEHLGAALAECGVADWERVLRINLTGVFVCMKAEIPQMVRTGGGVIVNTASVAGLTSGVGMSAYVASKHGVVGLTKAAALDYAKQGIRVNAIAPGLTRTAMLDVAIRNAPASVEEFSKSIPMGRPPTPQEMAEAVVWLASDRSSYATGVTLPVDGGSIVP